MFEIRDVQTIKYIIFTSRIIDTQKTNSGERNLNNMCPSFDSKSLFTV